MDKLKNLSIRKTIVLYQAISLICCFFFSVAVINTAQEIQEQIWQNYADNDAYIKVSPGEGRDFIVETPRPDADEMTRLDLFVSELCDFLQTYTILIICILGSCAAVFLFYRNKLKIPIDELNMASQKIAGNDLEFHIVYENRDEMGKLCRQFERMREQLEKNNRQLWDNIEEERALRAAIAHDIRSPLSVLKGYQEMLMEYLPEGNIDKNRAMEMLTESSKQIKRMDSFVETMRKMSSLSSRKLVPETITAEQLQNDIQPELSILGKEFGKRCILNTAQNKGSFCGDKAVILEVTENLLSNALRYAEEQVTVTLTVTCTEVRVCVKDDGIGLQEAAEEVTKLFYQQNIKDSLEHAGIGMYLSRLYCEKHGGQLLLENGKQGGAVITAVFHRIV